MFSIPALAAPYRYQTSPNTEERSFAGRVRDKTAWKRKATHRKEGRDRERLGGPAGREKDKSLSWGFSGWFIVTNSLHIHPPSPPLPPSTTQSTPPPIPTTQPQQSPSALHLDHLILPHYLLPAFSLLPVPQSRSRMSYFCVPGHFLCASVSLEPKSESALPTGPNPHGLSQHARFTTCSLDFTLRNSHYRRELFPFTPHLIDQTVYSLR